MLEIKPELIPLFQKSLPEAEASQIYFDGLMAYLIRKDGQESTDEELRTVGHQTGFSVVTRKRKQDHGVYRTDKIGTVLEELDQQFGINFEEEVDRIRTLIPELVHSLNIPDESKQHIKQYLDSVRFRYAANAEGDQYGYSGLSVTHDSIPYIFLYPWSIVGGAYTLAHFFGQEVSADLIKATIAETVGHELGHKVAESLAETSDDFKFPPQVQESFFKRFPIDFSSPESEEDHNFAQIFPHITLKECFADYFCTWASSALGYRSEILLDKARLELVHPYITGLPFHKLHTYTQGLVEGICAGSPKPEEVGHEMCMASLTMYSSMYKNYGLFYLYPFTRTEIEDLIKANYCSQ